MELIQHIKYIPLLNSTEVAAWIGATVSFLVSLLTLYNAARLKTGMIAVSAYLFGVGMLCLSTGFLLLSTPDWAEGEVVTVAYRLLFILGFIFLGLGSFQIYRMSQIK